MKKLFVLGNGFDIAHGLPTQYSKFKDYLQETFIGSIAPTFEFTLPKVYKREPTEEYYLLKDIAVFLCSLINKSKERWYLINEDEDMEHWNTLEKTIGILNIEYFLDFIDLDSEIVESTSMDIIADCTSQIIDFLTEWINDIKINPQLPLFSELSELFSECECNFLSFNYTQTLEIVYGVKKVCHIHGKSGEELIFGHCNESDISNKNRGLYITEALRKDTRKALRKHIDFFEVAITNTTEFYSYGFSFAKVDLVYIKKICELVESENCIWYIIDTMDEEADERMQKSYNIFKDALVECGFCGQKKEFRLS